MSLAMCLRSSFGAVILLASLFIITASAEEFVVANRSLTLSPPPDYCALSKARPEEAVLIDRLRKGNAGRNEVLLAFVRCDELDRWREGKDHALLHHGHYLTALTGGKAVPIDGTTRRAFIAQLERAVPKLDRKLLKDAVNDAVAGSARGQLAQFKQGIAGKDDNAIHIANLGLFETDGKQAEVAGMTSITLLKGILVSANLYRPFETDASFDALLVEARGIAAAMVDANSDTTTITPAAPRRFWLLWVGLVVAFGLFGIAAYLRFRR